MRSTMFAEHEHSALQMLGATSVLLRCPVAQSIFPDTSIMITRIPDPVPPRLVSDL